MEAWAAAAGLLMVTLVCCAAGQSVFSVSVDQDVYRAEEHGNVTMTWRFPTQTDMPPLSLFIDVMYVNPMRSIFLFRNGKDDPNYQDEFYRGRVWCDVKGSGRVECLFKQLRLSDSGMYQCVVAVAHNEHFNTCDLTVSAASKQPTAKDPKPASRGRTPLYVALALFVITAAVLAICAFSLRL